MSKGTFKDRHDKMNLKFFRLLTKLDMLQIMGCVRLLGVKVSDGAPEDVKATKDNLSTYIRPPEEFLVEALDAFNELPMKEKKKMISIMKAAQ